MSVDFDVVIIGTGAGGGTIGWQLASRGKKVLYLERGSLFTNSESGQREQDMLIDMVAADQRIHQFDHLVHSPFTGGIAGGSSSLYGACLLRPGASDFTPGEYYGDLIDPAIHRWPLSFEEFEPWLEIAEDLYKVSGNHEYDMPYLSNRKHPYEQTPMAFHSKNTEIMETLENYDLRPFPLPLAINGDRCENCGSCPGYICPNNSRASSLNTCIQPAVDQFGATLWTDIEIVSIEKERASVKRISVLKNNKLLNVTADCFILSAGAIGSPVFLMQHDLTGNNMHIGRNYMYHLGLLFSAVGLKETGSGKEFVKQIGLSDFYLDKNSTKLGYIQQLPIPGPLTMRAELPIPWELPIPLPFLNFIIHRNVTFAGAIEDLPLPENRIQWKHNRICIHHEYHSYDLHRARIMKKLFGKILRKLNNSLVISMIADREKLHVAHQVGTCRFGLSPKHSALDKNCRLHHLDNLFVVDGSFLPNSLGVGPALTIIANSLRVGAYIAGEQI